MRIAILCNDRIALPALDQLLTAGMVVAVGMPVRSQEMKLIVQGRCAAARIPLQLFGKQLFREELLLWLQQYQPDVVLVKTFPWLIPAEALAMPVHGFINFHYAPLPEWRGANPLFWMIRNRVSVAGVTVHMMNEAFDEGPIVLQQAVPLSPDYSFGFMYTQLAYTGLLLTSLLLDGLLNGSLEPREQEPSNAVWYNRPSAKDLYINWETMDAMGVKALVNACNPWNKGAATYWKGWTFGISNVSVTTSGHHTTEPGTILSMDPDKGFSIACRDGRAIRADVVYCEEGFYPGYRLAAFGLQRGDRLS